ncbi:hypothetical protein GCM10009645_15960 [Mycolicibacterium poriferae]|uniref:HTH tetR-type domain-containing protein n=1 Tax=Mycolicibacterium poriferae TaxID=39694 RepID=A0A6N4V692_9MYCO|nr:TetR/AcrR family transcriptional regulator [Mycolicibacterium poriferae]MCV7262872.1 TetR/AcrR family transcriptional regulator [Mycolicibacterium poriferae]BBX50425.1 hypothetical protein MPOR_14510 [Mycolicibacterium poriferae]
MDERLSSGRHHLSPDEVAADQQKRLFKALAVVMGEKGYSNTTVGDLIKHARVSRATFYQQFESKQDCFMAGYARMQSNVLGGLRATPVLGSPMARFRAMLTNYLNFLAADPPTARLYLVEVYAAGPEALRRRMQLQQDFVAGVAEVFAARSKADRFACQALVAAISMLVTGALADGDAQAILALEKPLVEFTERALPASLH